MEKKIGFIGCGNMGKAILGGLIASGQVLPGQIWVYTPSPDKVAALHDQYGINAAQSAQEVAQVADIVFGAVKPGIMIKVLSEVTSSLNKESLVVSIAAGVTLDQLARALGHDRKIVRAMPNTPSLVNAGMTSVTPNALVTPEDTADVWRSRSHCRADDSPGGWRQRLRPGVCFYVYRSNGRCRCTGRDAARAGLQICRSGGHGFGKDGAGNRRASWRTERYGLFAWRHDD